MQNEASNDPLRGLQICLFGLEGCKSLGIIPPCLVFITLHLFDDDLFATIIDAAAEPYKAIQVEYNDVGGETYSSRHNSKCLEAKECVTDTPNGLLDVRICTKNWIRDY